MAYDNEELNKRREKRAKQKAQRVRQVRKLRLQLLAAAAVLVLCGGLIWGVTRMKPQKTAEPKPTVPAPTEAKATEASSVATETQPEPFTTIHIAAAGDINVTDSIIEAGNLGTNFNRMFMDVLPLLAEADLTTVNFEGSLIGPPYGSVNASAPEELMEALAQAGVDVVQLANSYSIRNGISGLVSTIQGVRMAGLEPVGVYATPQEAKKSGGYVILDVGGLRVGLVSFTKGMDGMTIPAGNEGCVNLLYTDYNTKYQNVDTKGITKVLKALKEEKPDITVALVHWGSEYNDTISTSQKEIRDLLLSEGVSVILGTHSHYVQGMEFDKEAGTFVCYSLGDFLSDADRAGTDYSVVVDLEITRDNDTGITKVTDYTYTPVYISTDYNTIQLMRIREAMTAYENNYIDAISGNTYDAMGAALQRAGERVNMLPDSEDSGE